MSEYRLESPHKSYSMGDFALESGEIVEDFRISYVTHGSLDSSGSNTVLVMSAIGSDHHRLDFLIGPGRALDPDTFFIVAADPIGNGLTTSPSNSRTQSGFDFPRFSIRDMVESQRRLLTEELGVRALVCIVGASMGGMQSLQYVVSHPDSVGSVVALTPMARTSPWSIAVNEAARRALQLGLGWNGRGSANRPDDGWRIWANILQILATRTPQALNLAFPNAPDVIDWIRECERAALRSGFDAVDWIYQSWAYDGHDIGKTPGFECDTARALASITAKTLILAPKLDLYNPVEEAAEIARTIPDARYVEISSVQGHQATRGADPADLEFLNRTIRAFLSQAGSPNN